VYAANNAGASVTVEALLVVGTALAMAKGTSGVGSAGRADKATVAAPEALGPRAYGGAGTSAGCGHGPAGAGRVRADCSFGQGIRRGQRSQLALVRLVTDGALQHAPHRCIVFGVSVIHVGGRRESILILGRGGRLFQRGRGERAHATCRGSDGGGGGKCGIDAPLQEGEQVLGELKRM